MAEVFDFIIIGSGAGGSTAAYVLTDLGLRVLMIEEGSDLRDTYSEKSASWILEHGYRKSGLNAFLGIPPVPFGEGRLLGGTTELNGGLMWDTPPAIFDRWREKTENGGGYLNWVSDAELRDSWNLFTKLLDVKHEKEIGGFDVDSALMAKGFERMGLETHGARRATTHCQRANRCAFGCPSGAKNSMGLTLIPLSVRAGLEILTDQRVVHVDASNELDAPSSVHISSHGGSRVIYGHRIVIAAGTNQSPDLVRKALRKSILVTRKSFHLNVKVLGVAKQNINAQRGTLFTRQLQTHLSEGILIMPSQTSDEAMLLAAAPVKSSVFKQLVADWRKAAVFTIQVAMKTKVTQFSSRLGSFSLHFLGRKDLVPVRKGATLLLNALHLSGEFERYLISPNQASLCSYEAAKARFLRASFSNLDISSVHAMANLPLGGKHIDDHGRIRSLPNVYVMDASVLPSETIESPQGSIMQTVFHLARRAGQEYLDRFH